MRRFYAMRALIPLLATIMLVGAALAQTQDDALRQENQRRINDALRQQQQDIQRQIDDDMRRRTDNDARRMDEQGRLLEEMKRSVPPAPRK